MKKEGSIRILKETRIQRQLLEIAQGQPFLNVLRGIRLAARIQHGNAVPHQPRRQENIRRDHQVISSRLSG